MIMKLERVDYAFVTGEQIFHQKLKHYILWYVKLFLV